jgi:hypothetical protein
MGDDLEHLIVAGDVGQLPMPFGGDNIAQPPNVSRIQELADLTLFFPHGSISEPYINRNKRKERCAILPKVS